MRTAESVKVAKTLAANSLPVNLDAPGVYQEQVELARSMEAFIVAMPLEELVDRTDDKCGIAYLGMNPEGTRELRQLRSLFTVLRFAKKELLKIQRGGR